MRFVPTWAAGCALALAAIVLAPAACSDAGQAPTPPAGQPPGGQPSTTTAVLLAAGDIASCGTSGAAETAAILDTTAGTVLALGDEAYPTGTPDEFSRCYAPTWGQFKSRTRPVPGNHEYLTADAAGYFGYFGASVGTAETGYYSYDVGGWHLIALNSNIAMNAGSPQEQWLRADLAAHPAKCTLAYWHHPRFSSGNEHGNNAGAQPLWQALYDAGADLVLNGHEHIYERFAPQTPTGVADPARGLREFVVGTGGASHYGLGTRQPNSEVVDDSTFGVLRLTLHDGSYDWRFLPVAGGTFADSGSAACH